MKNSFIRAKLNPIKIIKNLFPQATDKTIRHIKFDDKMKLNGGDYYILRQSTHDGTLLFSSQLIATALSGLLRMESFCKKSEPKDWSKIKRIEYTVGHIYKSICFGMIELPISKTKKYPGQKERVRIPVKISYVL